MGNSETAHRHTPRGRYFVVHDAPGMQSPPEPHTLPPIRCPDCSAVDIWCRRCETNHPIRVIDQHVHVAHCDRSPATPMSIRIACPLAGKAETDQALDQAAYIRKREMTAGIICLLAGFVLGVVLTLATIATLQNAYSPPATSNQLLEQ